METPRIASTRPQPGPSDRRRYPRRTIPGIRGTLRSPGDVEVLDISLTGLAAEVAGEVTTGEHCFLELRHGRSVAMVEAEVKWSAARLVDREADRPVMRYFAGMAFVDVDRDDSGIWSCILPETHA